MEPKKHQIHKIDLNQLEEKAAKGHLKHRAHWQDSRSAVGVIQNTKDFNVQLTTLSDQKANIVIAASSLIITFGLRPLGSYDGLIFLAILVLIVGAALALLFAILSVTPLFQKQAKKMEINSPTFNPLFFGHYTDVDMDDYIKHMVEVLKDQDQLYEAMLKDIYQMGLVLKHRKYKYLAYSYNLFFLGICLCLVILAIALVYGLFVPS